MFFEPVRIDGSHRRSVREQVKSGLRLGIGSGMWLIAIMLMGSGLNRVIWGKTFHPLIWADWVGWLELAIACVLLLVSAHVWYLVLAGYGLFAFFKSVVILIAGHTPYAPYGPFPRLEAAELAGFALLTLGLLFRFAGTRLTIPDRIALTIYMFAFLRFGNIAVQSLGLIALAISWCVDLLIDRARGARHYKPVSS